MKKVYFINRAVSQMTCSAKWRNTLKQTYKSTDAIRDIIEWSGEGREFYVAIRDLRANGPRLVFHVNPPGSSAMMTDFATKRPVVGIIDMILQWTQDGRDYDITLLERKRSERHAAADAPTHSGRLRYLGKARN